MGFSLTHAAAEMRGGTADAPRTRASGFKARAAA